MNSREKGAKTISEDIAKAPSKKFKRNYNSLCTIGTQCRICLTHCFSTRSSLSAPLDETQNLDFRVVDALESLTNEKIRRGQKYPDTVCRMCLGYLKIAYNLVEQYKESKKILAEKLKESGTDIATNEFEEEAPITKKEVRRASVEIVIGTKTFDIKNLLVVEEEDQEKSFTFDGFLKNLGTTITASFVEKGYKKPKLALEAPSLVIEKIGQEKILEEIPVEIVEIPDESDPISDHNSNENNNDDILEEIPSDFDLIGKLAKTLDPVYEDETVFINNFNPEVIDSLTWSNENDKSAVESALKLHYRCPYCSKPMTTLKRAKNHLRKCSKNTRDVHCYVCDVDYKNRLELLSHIRETHTSKLREYGDLPSYLSDNHFKCNLCDEVFETRSKLAYHTKKHEGRTYGCDKCDKTFFTKDYATKHARSHNKDQTAVVCQICGKGFHYKNALHYHLKMHAGERNLQCSYCPNRYYTRNSLKRHELAHTGERPYSCKFCDKKFRSLGETKQHQYLHTDERPHKCEYCGAGFTQRYNLKQHMTTHFGQFKCDYCDKGFTDNVILRFHINTRHRNEQAEIIEETQKESRKEGINAIEYNNVEEDGIFFSANSDFYYPLESIIQEIEEVPIEYSDQLIEEEAAVLGIVNDLA